MDRQCESSLSNSEDQVIHTYTDVEEEFAELDLSDPVENVTKEFYQEMISIVVEEWKPLNDIRVQIKFKNGNKYIGEVEDVMLQGEGIYTWTNGTVYEGMFEQNSPDGYGILTNSSDEYYKGYFKRGIKHGDGHLEGKNFIYKGGFQNGLFQGQGRYMSIGFCCEGEFTKNKIVNGTARYNNGFFEGIFDENENRKTGNFCFNNTNDIYSGEWENDKFDGFGKYEWYTPNNSNSLIQFQKQYYIGYWYSGHQNGIGLINFLGITVMCNWKMGKKHGPGFIIASNGDIFVSNVLFLNNQYHKCWQLSPNLLRSNSNIKHEIEHLLELVYVDDKSNNGDKKRCFAFEKRKYFFEKIQSTIEIFNDTINSLLTYRSSSVCSDIYPVFILDFHLMSNVYYLEELLRNFAMKMDNTNDWYLFEIKCLNQVIKENLNKLHCIYSMYTKVCGNIDENIDNVDSSELILMPRLGLWLFYWDVLKNFPKINTSEIISQVEQYNGIFQRNSRSATESVYFWHFIRHILHIIATICCNNSTIACQMVQDGSEMFGTFATMLITFLRELREVETFSNSNIVNILEKNGWEKVLKLFQITESLNEEKLVFRSIYRFVANYRETFGFLMHINDENLFQFGSKVFPNLMFENYIQETSFEVTSLEFWEVILLCVESDIRQKKLKAFELEEQMKNPTSDIKTKGKMKGKMK